MSTKLSRPFRIIALPLVRIPHGPLRVAPRAAAAGQQAPATSAVASAGASSSSASSSSSSTSTASSSLDQTAASTAIESADASSADSTTTNAPLVLYQVQQPDRATADGQASIVTRALTKASDLWLGFGEKDKGTWQRKVFERGEKLMDRIEYEEWALKSIHEDQGVKIAKKGEEQERIEISLLRPAGLGVPPLLPKLHRALIHRIPHHRKMMIRFLVFSPITWPFAIIPVIPNFPLFYVLWRAWSHYKAWRGATYLEAVLKAGMITEKESSTLDNIYAHHRADVKDGKIIKEGGDGADFYPGMMITTAEVPDLKKAFDLRPAEVVDVERAIEQASHRARDGAKVLQLKAEGKSEKAELKFKKEE
ncbi:uncharacterized protein EHS24_000984 [Apiotrichum porosum]|uniref:Uncharacterized protein n=1 Tax=Apiotrichum porosum TaxID=105984 RepID=A0A427YBA6_9TREE|nr:uncharacterized protein EHS24_000984 [Apiotrichum porosum]RSH88439.1 hypothetical protein EHS24_000984 [Apiotrichum porosum]